MKITERAAPCGVPMVSCDAGSRMAAPPPRPDAAEGTMPRDGA
jgi:hypothetical protein